MENKKVNCPIIEKGINEIDCYEVHTVLWGYAKEDILKKEIRQTEGYQSICEKCPHHRSE